MNSTENTTFFTCSTALYTLEQDWRNIVENPEQLSEKYQHQQTALWELLQTEVAYIRTLKVVTDVSENNLLKSLHYRNRMEFVNSNLL